MTFVASPLRPFRCNLHVQDISSMGVGDDATRHRLVFHSVSLQATPQPLSSSHSPQSPPPDTSSPPNSGCIDLTATDRVKGLDSNAAEPCAIDLSDSDSRADRNPAPRSPLRSCMVAQGLLNCEDKSEIFWVGRSRRPQSQADSNSTWERKPPSQQCCLTPVLSSVDGTGHAQVAIEHFSAVTSRVILFLWLRRFCLHFQCAFVVMHSIEVNKCNDLLYGSYPANPTVALL
jgi:hypothetical protein